MRSIAIVLFLSNKFASAQLRHARRDLEELPATFLGEDLPYPLGACQGECIDDSDCVAGLTCTSRNSGEIVRGCSLTLELLFSSVNFCVLDATHDPLPAPTTSFEASNVNDEPTAEIVPAPRPVSAPVIVPTPASSPVTAPSPIAPVNVPTPASSPVNVPTPLSAPVNVPTPVSSPVVAPSSGGISSTIDAVYVGNGANSNLSRCFGDCDADSDCAPGLFCFQRSAGQNVPGCSLSADLAASDFDFCYDPRPQVNPPALTPAVFVGNGVNSELGLCFGDCDSDANCAGDLICYQRSEGDEVPGCLLSEELLVSSFDFCTEASFTFAPSRAPVPFIIPTAPVPVPTPVTMPVPLPTPVMMPVPLPTPVTMPVPLPTPVMMPVPLPTPVTMPVPLPTPVMMPVPLPTPVMMPVPAQPSAPVTSPVAPAPSSPVMNPISMPVVAPNSAPFPSAPVPLPPAALPSVVFPPTQHPTRPRSIDWTRPTPHPTRPRSVDWPRPTPHPTRPRSVDWPAPTSHPTRPRSVDWPAPTSHPTTPRSVDNGSHEPRDAVLISNVDNAFLGACEGDCDRDSQCAHGLICFHREEGDSLPYCGLSAELKATNIDFCIPDPKTEAEGGADEVSNTMDSNATFTAAFVSQPEIATTVSAATNGSFALKLYWEEGYYWQHESYERKWCVGCQSSCTPGNNVAVYNCDDMHEQWTFVEYNDGSAQIQNYNWELCLQIVGGDKVVLASCDETVMEQRFVALGGSFDYYRFELSPLMKPGLCFTQDHHPKMDETISLHSCTKARRDTTSFWNKY